MNGNNPVIAREEHPEAVVLRILVPELVDDEQGLEVQDALFQEIGLGNEKYVIDMTAVQWLSSPAIGWLLTLRNSLPVYPPKWRLFTMFHDQASALQAIRDGRPDSLILCVSPMIEEIFSICSSA